MKKHCKLKPHLIASLLSLAWLAGCEQTEPVFNSRFMAFGTLNDISIVGVSREDSVAAVAALEADFRVMHDTWHAWNPGPLTRTNALIKEGTAFTAPPSVLALTREAKRLAGASEQLFNPAIGHLINLWGFQGDLADGRQPPEDNKIRELVKKNPSMNDITVDDHQISASNPYVKLDYGAIGKGYGIDKAIERLRDLGIKNAIVNSGGDLRAIGSRSGHPWRIAIRNPSGSGVLGFLHVNGDESIFTSGNYERNFIWEGKLYHHIIDPRTGYPAEDTASVTVIHSEATTADAAATALFVAGPDLWHRIAKSMGIKYVMLVDSRGNIHMNPAMADRVQLNIEDPPVIISPSLMQ